MSSKFQSIVVVCLWAALNGYFSTSFAELSQDFINETNASIDTLRKRQCTLTVKFHNQPLLNGEISVRQLRNHFGFGAATPKWPFFNAKIDSALYDSTFRTYFEWVTPENEMKWNYTDAMDDYQNYEDADWLIAWSKANDLNVRGHSLFWNEHTGWIPSWSKELDTAQFKAAMKRRITGAMTHFKGKVVHWDLINEIVHGDSGNIVIPGMLAQKSGDTAVFQWIFKEARKIDPDVKMGVNEYSIIGQWSQAKEYISEIKHIESGDSAKIDIVGLEGHLGTYVEWSRYRERIDTVAGALPGKEIWLTEVDFAIDTLIRADKMEELMRTCFAHPSIGGLMLWVWWEGNMWRPIYTSFLVDSNLTENELGARWRSVRSEWKTFSSGITGAEGTFGFKGFHGKYVASLHTGDSLFVDTFYLDPGAGPKSIEINLDSGTGITEPRGTSFHTVPFRLNGQSIRMLLPSAGNDQLYLSTYTLAGKLLARTPVTIEKGSCIRSKAPSGCHIYRIENADRILYTGKGMAIR